MLIRWSDLAHNRTNNFSIFNDLQKEMDSLFREFSPTLHKRHRTHSAHYPNINIYDEEDNVLLVAEVPGMKQEDLNIQVNAEGITVKGERKQDLPEDAKLYRSERSGFQFERSFAWPVAVQLDEIHAQLKDGMLHIRIAKAPESKPRNIEIKAL